MPEAFSVVNVDVAWLDGKRSTVSDDALWHKYDFFLWFSVVEFSIYGHYLLGILAYKSLYVNTL